MRQFVPVPYDALSLVTPAEYGAVVDLYQRAHRLRWRPFTVTTRSLETAWGLSTRKVWDVLCLLEGAGLLTMQRGDHRRPTTVQLEDPASENTRSGAEHRVEHSAEHSAERSKVPRTEDIERTGTQGGTHVGTHAVTTLGEPEPEPEPEPEENTAPPADPPPAIREPVLVSPVERPPVADDWAQLAAHYAALPWARKPTDRKKGNGKALATILREAGSLADAKALIDWWATADDDRALFLRYGKSREPDPLKPSAAPQQGLETVARHADDYRDRAIAWQARGSPVERGRGRHGAGYTPRPHRPSDDEPELDF